MHFRNCRRGSESGRCSRSARGLAQGQWQWVSRANRAAARRPRRIRSGPAEEGGDRDGEFVEGGPRRLSLSSRPGSKRDVAARARPSCVDSGRRARERERAESTRIEAGTRAGLDRISAYRRVRAPRSTSRVTLLSADGDDADVRQCVANGPVTAPSTGRAEPRRRVPQRRRRIGGKRTGDPIPIANCDIN